MKNLLLLIICVSVFSCKKSNTTPSTTIIPLPVNYISVVINSDTVKGGSAAGALQLTFLNGGKVAFDIGIWYSMGREVVSPGTYDLSTGYYNSYGAFEASYASYSNDTDIYYTDASHTGSINIDTSGGTISGGFSFIGVDANGKTINITNGIINKVSL